MFNRIFHRTFFLAITFFLVTVSWGRGVVPHDGISDQIERIRNKYDNIGLAVAVVKNNRIVYSETFGYNPDPSDPTKGVPIQPDDIFYIASVSKTFVGTAIMQLVEKGRLSLEDDVNRYLDFSLRNPRFPDVPITIRMLLSHRSSLKKNAHYIDFDKINPEIAENIQTYFNDYPPGKKSDYSNLGYSVLGAVIEKVTGQRFDVYVQENILQPLRIYGGYDVSKLDSKKFVRSCQYNAKKGCFEIQKKHFVADTLKLRQYRLGYSTPLLGPAGGLKISANDLAKYMIMHMKGGKKNLFCRVLSKESEAMMRERQNKTMYGLSFVHFKKVIPEVTLIGMQGGKYGMHTSMYFHPEKKYGFVVLCNGCRSKTEEDVGLNNEVIRMLYDSIIVGH